MMLVVAGLSADSNNNNNHTQWGPLTRDKLINNYHPLSPKPIGTDNNIAEDH